MYSIGRINAVSKHKIKEATTVAMKKKVVKGKLV
jgi:hypothetical protein